ncbi:hypothetical protein [Streptomyces sp. NPDC050548]|uniref:hypothetical protein n=1 Tax=Streptomyces sp. NPDC050548 TaxID=3365629 RepID=UPI0037B1B01A
MDAVDFSAVAPAEAETLAAERGVQLRTQCTGLTARGAPEAAYDLALITHLQLPWPQVLGLAATAVRSGGTLLPAGHDTSNREHGFDGPQDPASRTPRNRSPPNGRPYARILRAETVTRPVDGPQGPRTAIDSLVRAECL